MNTSNSRLFFTYIAVVILVLLGIGAIVMPLTSPAGKVIVGLTLLGSLIIFLILIVNLFDKYIKPVRSATRVADELVKGNYRVRTYVSPYGEAGKLSNSVNELARNLQEMTIQEKMQESQLKTVVDNMDSGLMLIDERGYVHLVNQKFSSIFSIDPQDVIGYLYYNIIDEQSIHKAVQEAFLYEKEITDSFTSSMELGSKFVEIVGAPILNEANRLKGTVLVFHDITEFKQLEQMRKDFVANVSHELKTPVTSIRGFAETLLEGAMNDPELNKQFLTTIFDESKRLQALVQDLLELSELEKDELQLQTKEIDLAGLFKEIRPFLDQQAAQQQIHFSSSISENLVMTGDTDRMKQVLLNLITNAMIYTPARGKVDLTMDGTDDMIKIKVSDTGIGIPEEERSRIFERFYRVDKARSRNTGGTGLGLAIVKHIVEAHNGKIELDSKLGQGTTFKLTFPKYIN
ncbi:two-component system histidine kinase PnpS [Lentibacillus cibarius]|uniref:histidine kinase n=1 Tax=Lentibacillus cibarius TaxID=2583219 RepID=A0A5S3QLA0_9BACI|nr:HAMP domain-containing sensor histidine kinase [Lentibacillus cibarius]TMN22714.1 cell wall metabolism sensor histidine kinase WalK [Lentibacillus cibarius]